MTKVAQLRGRKPAPKVKVKPQEKSVENEEINEVKDNTFIQSRKSKSNFPSNLLSQGETIKIHDFTYSENGLYFSSKDKNSGEVMNIKISDRIHVEDVVHNIDDRNTSMNLMYDFNGNYISINSSMRILQPNELIKLVGKGVDIPYQYRNLISTFLNEQRKQAPHRNVYCNLGWHKAISSNDLLYRHSRVFTREEFEMAECDEELSEYDVKPNGHLTSWKNMFRNHVEGNVYAETLVCIGVSSILVGYLAKINKDMDSLLIHLYGNSTQGKTTGAMLAVSLIGNPSSKGKGLIKSWNGTSNAIINSLGGNYGVPIVLDELSMTKEKELTSEIYTIANGKDKARLTDSITQRKQADWATTIISTGEQSLLERTNKNAGLSIRAIEFANIQWTKSAENSEAIKEVCLKNYGVGAEPIVQYITNIKEEGIQTIINQWREKLINEITDSNFKQRIANKLAIILATGEVIKNALRINLDLEGIFKFLVENEEENMLERDIGMKSFNQIVQKVIENKGYFKINKSSIQKTICWGLINPKETYYEVIILKNILENNLRELGYGDPKVIIKEWKNRNLLDAERDRSSKRVRMFSPEEMELRKKSLGKDDVPGKLEDTAYSLKIPREYLDDYLLGS